MNSTNSEENGTRVRDCAGVFDAYVRVFNPAYRSATRQPVAWSTLAEPPIVLDTRVPLNARLVISPPERTLFVVSAPVQSAAQLNSSPRRALRWWPGDESWRVGNDIYARTVFIGGRRKTIDAIRADLRLESIIVGPDDHLGLEDL